MILKETRKIYQANDGTYAKCSSTRNPWGGEVTFSVEWVNEPVQACIPAVRWHHAVQFLRKEKKGRIITIERSIIARIVEDIV